MESMSEVLTSRWQQSASTALSHLWSRPVGQALLRHLDRLLWTLEKTHHWSVPPNPDKPANSELTRPLPWLIFLPLLAVLRVSRETASFAALLLGKEPFRPADIVKVIQQRRRAVRALKYQGTRAMRARAHHARQAPRSVWLWTLTRPVQIFIRIATAGVFFAPHPCKVHHEHTDKANNSHKRQDTEENLLEKLLQNADLSDNTSTDDSSYTLKNESDTDESSSASENRSFNTVEEIGNLKDVESGNSCTSSPVKDSDSNTTYTVPDDDEKQDTLTDEVNNKEEGTSSNQVSPEDKALVNNVPNSDGQPAGIKEATEDILNSEREACDRNRKVASSSMTPPKNIQNDKSPKRANGEATKPKDIKARDSPSKIYRKGSVPVVKVTLAEDEDTGTESEPSKEGNASREGNQ